MVGAAHPTILQVVSRTSQGGLCRPILFIPAYYLIWPQKAQKTQKQSFRACNFSVLHRTKIEILTFYESINVEWENMKKQTDALE